MAEEASLLAYFHTPEQAEGVAAKLRALRAIDVSVDRFRNSPNGGVDESLNPLSSQFGGLAHLTLGGDYDNIDAAILAAADVSASGMSDGGQEPPSGIDIVLAAVVDKSILEQAQRVIREGGGSI